MAEYITRDGDMIDWICWKYYGQQVNVVEAVLEANPILSEYGAVLPFGIKLTLPDIVLPESEEIIRLWD